MAQDRKTLPPPPNLLRIRHVGLKRAPHEDLYHTVLTNSWWLFFLIVAAAFLSANALFGVGYLLEPGSISNSRSGSFEDAFFFSVQTMATIGYGGMAPAPFRAMSWSRSRPSSLCSAWRWSRASPSRSSRSRPPAFSSRTRSSSAHGMESRT